MSVIDLPDSYRQDRDARITINDRTVRVTVRTQSKTVAIDLDRATLLEALNQ